MPHKEPMRRIEKMIFVGKIDGKNVFEDPNCKRLTKEEITYFAKNIGKKSRQEVKIILLINERTKFMSWQNLEKELNRVMRKIK